MQIIPVRRPIGYFAIVDDDDADYARSLRLRTIQQQSVIYIQSGRRWLHRLVWERHNGPLGNRVIDHRNGIGIDCRKANLRTMTLANVSALRRDKSRGIHRHHDVDDRGRLLSSVHYIVVHRRRTIGHYREYGDALAAKLAAEQRDGFPTIDDRDALKQDLIRELDQLANNGILLRRPGNTITRYRSII